jgi:RNA polymerase sigma factor (sigma-70 family)
LIDGLASSQETLRRNALERFIEAYWKPAYKYIRLKWRRDAADAEDLTQGFFTGVLQKSVVDKYEPERGSFHHFLRVAIDNYVRNQIEAGARAKRGGGMQSIPLDFPAAEQELAAVAAGASPEELFHREWQREIFALAVKDLEELAEKTGKAVHYACFAEFDLATGDRLGYEALAAKYGVPVTQVTNYLAWARRELRRLALDRVAGVTGTPGEFRTEARRLFET